MVKRNPVRTRDRRSRGIELFMECTEEALSPSQITAHQVAVYQYDQALAQIRDAQAKARIGKARIINKMDTVGRVTPQPKPTTQKPISPVQKVPERSTSPDIIFVGATPPTKSNPPPQQQGPQPRSLVVNSRSPNVPTSVQQQVFQLVNINQSGQTVQQGVNWLVKPVANVMPQQQQKVLISGNPNQHTSYKRPIGSTSDITAKKKPKLSESDEAGNWVPLDEYYYGKMEGDPTYQEEKNEYRFKCWYCNKMLYNNVKAMMHIQGHIDSSKQQNIDLSDLTQCKHCYKQFDTPFEMQTHVDKVHMSNTNVLLCRICDRDHDSRTALTNHMRQNHKACEMPYTCQLCKFRSSMYSDVVDHFKKKHDSSQHLLCLYCLRVFVVKFVSQGWGTTQTYYGHLLKHQSKAQNKKCGLCRLSFFNAAEVKAHKLKHHLSNQKAVLGTAAHSSKPDQVLIKVPSSQKLNNLKSLNAPSVTKVLDFGGTTFPIEVHHYNCFECKMSMGTHDHYRKYIECSMCRFATICSIAYANHMMGFHSGQMSSLNLNIPWERKMAKPMHCLCGFSSSYGNKIANHLVFCMKSSCYEKRPEVTFREIREEEMVDPRNKPGASLLDALGLVKKRTVTPGADEGVYEKPVEMSPTEEIKPFDPDYIPPDLTTSQKWKNVKLKSPDITPSKDYLWKSSKHGKSTSEERKEKTLLDFDNENSSESLADETNINNIIDKLDEDQLLKDDNSDESKDSGKLSKDDGNDKTLDESKEEESLLKEDGNEKMDDNEKDEEMLLQDDENSEKLDERNEKLDEISEKLDENKHETEKEDENLTKDDDDDDSKEKTERDEEKLLKDDENESTKEQDGEDIEVNEDNLLKDDNVKSDEKDNGNEDNSTSNKDSQDKVEDSNECSSSCDAERTGTLETENLEQGTSSSEPVSKEQESSFTESVGIKQAPGSIETDSVEQEPSSTVPESVEKEPSSAESVSVEQEPSSSEPVNVKQDSSLSDDTDSQPESNSAKCDDKNNDIDIADSNETSTEQETYCSETQVTDSSTEQDKAESQEPKLTSQKVEENDSSETKKESSDTKTCSENQRSDEGKMVTSSSNIKDNSEKDAKYLEKEGNSERLENKHSSPSSSSHHQPRTSYTKDSYHERRDDRGHHRDRSYDQHRSHDNRHDRRSHYDDRSNHYYQGRQDDRNKYNRHDRDAGYHDNRDYNNRRDNRDYHRDDRRHNRGHYQGHGGYGGSGYHGYR